MKKIYRVYSELSGKDYIDIEVDTKKVKNAIQFANPEELAQKLGIGLQGFKTSLMFNPAEAKFEVLTLSNNTKLEYPYLYPIYTIQGIYDIPYTLDELLIDSWYSHLEEDEEFREWIRRNKPEFLNEKPDRDEIKVLLDNLDSDIKENLWERELLYALEDEIQSILDNPNLTNEIINWLDENFEIYSLKIDSKNNNANNNNLRR